MSKKKTRISKIIDIVFTIIIIFIIIKIFGIYKQYYYNDFTKAEYNQGISKFSRDKEITYSYDYSYKIESSSFNDAIFYKEIEVKPNTPYRLSCMVKTDQVENEKEKSNSGAQIAIVDTRECSNSIIGTNDWQKLEFIFDSKNREKIQIGFRLGGNDSNSKGTAWFSDFKLEEGTKDDSTNWEMACFIIKNVDVTLKNQNIKLSMSVDDINDMKNNVKRFENSINTLSNNGMSAECDIYEINTPVKTVTYSEEFGYYLDPLDVKDLISKYLDNKEYDYIFVAVKLGDLSQNLEIPVYDWIGLRKYGFKWNRIFKY